jgi:hypothetical protein
MLIRSLPPLSRWLPLAIALTLPFTAGAQPDDRLRDELRVCAAKSRTTERLECYDALARGVGEPAAATAPESPESVARPARPKRENAPATAPDEPREIVSSVTELREIQPGRLEITLANGQVWRQTSADRYPLKVGHEVRVYPTRFGIYFRLTARELRDFVQVERVR